jgi:hypothetical protein
MNRHKPTTQTPTSVPLTNMGPHSGFPDLGFVLSLKDRLLIFRQETFITLIVFFIMWTEQDRLLIFRQETFITLIVFIIMWTEQNRLLIFRQETFITLIVFIIMWTEQDRMKVEKKSK